MHIYQTLGSREPWEESIAMEIADVTDPSTCILVDDSPANLEAAKQVGWCTVLVNPNGTLQAK
ncbi:hypothetical protein Pmar_PMAR025647 [Perkinsus marinus ATCC 50983]|uniref:Uncharacterized protein n=1 Tax=Perkinsus marinus (strain ATCC 50983 / TXsc) TaxID=423536 RepID=C5KIL9_PERM5|nr:hypothetical protein Pmar_PMAR025647 [Perkinsus marinus ATCC 50983]EER15634.1 hypothetical protein Pmar_PMAR025647 [Perkinsus marinus ATCC 50983]|eukprot:XP_002783838.1 hypothetical protein Pmar_PMAR025647 [Perkinsus marinus ATCC 50983]